jgi:hypothetical protein
MRPGGEEFEKLDRIAKAQTPNNFCEWFDALEAQYQADKRLWLRFVGKDCRTAKFAFVAVYGDLTFSSRLESNMRKAAFDVAPLANVILTNSRTASGPSGRKAPEAALHPRCGFRIVGRMICHPRRLTTPELP